MVFMCGSCVVKRKEEEEESLKEEEEIIVKLNEMVYNLALYTSDSEQLNSVLENSYEINLKDNNNNYYHPDITSIYNKNCILFDPGANCNIINSAELFETLKPCTRTIRVKGVGNETLLCEGTGTLIGPLKCVPAMYVPGVRASIVSEHVLEDFCEIERHKKVGDRSSFYVITNNFNGAELKCRKSVENLYCGDFSEEAEDNGKQIEYIAQMTIIDEMQLAGSSNTEIEKMFRVHEAHECTGFQSVYKMLLSKKHKTLAGTPTSGDFSEVDVRNYAAKMHPVWCRGCNASAFAEPACALDPVTSKGISEAHGDGWFLTVKVEENGKIFKQPYMLFVDNQTQNVFSFRLVSDGNTKDMIRVFDELIAMYAVSGHSLKKVKLDNWKTVVEKSETHRYLQSRGIDVIFATPGRHVRKAETFIGYLKSHLRKIIFSLRPSIILPLLFYEHAVKFTVQTLNLAPNGANHYLCPHSLFTGQEVSWKKHARHRFLEVVWVTHPKIADDKTLTQSSTLCLILSRREGSESGAYWVYDLATGQILARHQMVKAVLREEEQKRICNYINSIDSGATVLDIEVPTLAQQAEIDAAMQQWDEELIEEEQRMKKAKAKVGRSSNETSMETDTARSSRLVGGKVDILLYTIYLNL